MVATDILIFCDIQITSIQRPNFKFGIQVIWSEAVKECWSLRIATDNLKKVSCCEKECCDVDVDPPPATLMLITSQTWTSAAAAVLHLKFQCSTVQYSAVQYRVRQIN